MNILPITPETQKIFDYLEKHGIHRYHEDKPLYKYVTAATAKLILATHTIKFSTPLELNDNDLDISVLAPNIDEEQKAETITKIITNVTDYLPPRLRNTIGSKKNVGDWARNFQNDMFRDIVLESYMQQRGKLGLFCLTDSAENDYMWNKYADGGKGICIEFKFPTLFNKVFYAFKVCYPDTIQSDNLFDENGVQRNEVIQRWICTKAKRYSEEREVRIISDNIGICEMEDNSFITGIYQGKNTSKRTISKIEHILYKNGYAFTKVLSVAY